MMTLISLLYTATITSTDSELHNGSVAMAWLLEFPAKPRYLRYLGQEFQKGLSTTFTM